LTIVLTGIAVPVSADFTLRIYEQTGSINTYTFNQNDPRVFTDLAGLPGPSTLGYTGYDIGTGGCEFYDIFFCDSAGTALDIGPGDPLPPEIYLKLECWDISCPDGELVSAPTWAGAGNNIDAVSLNIDGQMLYGRTVVEEVYGLCDQAFELKTSNFADEALGPPDAGITKMGCGWTVITLYMGSVPSSDCEVSVNYPHSGTVYYIGGQHSIDVLPNICDDSVRLELYKGDTRLCHIADITGRWYEWYDVSDCGGGPGWDYRIKATCLSNPACYDFSDYFTMLDGASSCEIDVNYPHAATTFYIGGQHTIDITADGCGSEVSLELYRGITLLCHIADIAGTSYDWSGVSDCGSGPGTDYRIKATCLADPGCFDFSEFFTMVEGTGGCEVVVNHPDSAAIFYIGGQHMIDIVPNTCDGEVRLELYKGESLLCQIADMSGRWFEWYAVSDCGGGPGMDYRIKATCLSDPECFDFSDYFTMEEQDTSDTALAHDPLYAIGDPYLDWIQNGISWVSAEDGYIFGDVSYWLDALISRRAFDPSDDPFVIFRFCHQPDAANFMGGYTSVLPPENNFHYSNIELGIYIHSTGSIRPTWDVNNTSYWSTTIPAGFYDVMITLDGSAGTVTLAIDAVAGWWSPLADFTSPEWTSVEHRPIGGPYHIQINPYNGSSRIYDVWSSKEMELPPPPPPAPLILFVEDVGNDEGRQVRMKWQSSALDMPGSPEPVTGYALWRRIDTLPAWMDVSAAAVPGPVPMYPPGDWDYLGTVPACCEETYATILPTLADAAGEDDIHWSVFFVRALTGTPEIYFDSAPDSGYSVCDIFAPDPDEDPEEPPTADYLGRNHPNPFNPSTEISFGLKERGHVLIRIFDAGGRLVKTLVDAEMSSGDHAETWNGTDDYGRMAASGVYFCRLETKQITMSRKMVLLR
jgi:hypothetical protein